MSWAICQQAMDLHMSSLAGLDLTLVAWVNAVFPASGVVLDNKVHYRIALLPADSWAPYGTGTTRRFKGLYQVSVFAPIGKGSGVLTAAVDAVCAHFDRLNLTRGGITLSTEVPVPGPSLIDGQWVYTPITIPFYTR